MALEDKKNIAAAKNNADRGESNMRVIGGSKKGHPLKAPEGTTTRPTTDRVREAIFNTLQTRIADAVVLDVFAGSGGMSMEALSRGAAFADLCEKDRRAIAAIKQNIAFLGFAEKAKLWQGDGLRFLSQNTKKYDIIFLDPPYYKGLYEQTLTLILERGLLVPDGILVVEAAVKNQEALSGEIQNQLKLVKTAIYGDTKIDYYSL